MLTLTLRHLVEDGLISRTAYAEVPPRVEYELTELGGTLMPLVIALGDWAMEHHVQINANRKSYR
jgi:DNA-binding HxlR family transcriptional regulator